VKTLIKASVSSAAIRVRRTMYLPKGGLPGERPGLQRQWS
jgi:hypothetical protein